MTDSTSRDAVSSPSDENGGALAHKPLTLGLLAGATLLAMALWFSGSAVVP
jgi:hypothetical protein